MFLVYLHFLYLVGRNVFRRNGILATEQVHALNIEFVYRLSLIHYRAVLFHSHSCHSRYYVGNGAVFLFLVSAHEVVDGVAMQAQTLRFHFHFVENKGLFLQHDGFAFCKVAQHDDVPGIAHPAELHAACLFVAWQSQSEVPVVVGSSKDNRRAFVVLQNDRYALQGIAALVNYRSAVCLCNTIKRNKQQKGKNKSNLSHFYIDLRFIPPLHNPQ